MIDAASAGEELHTKTSANTNPSDPSLEVIVFMSCLPVCDADLVTSVEGELSTGFDLQVAVLAHAFTDLFTLVPYGRAKVPAELND